MTVTKDITDQIDSEESIFVILNDEWLLGSLVVYFNGVKLLAGNDFAEIDNTSFQAGFVPQINDTLQIQYENLEGDVFPAITASGTDPNL